MNSRSATSLIWLRVRRVAGAAVLIVMTLGATSAPRAAAQIVSPGTAATSAGVAAYVVWAASTTSGPQEEGYGTGFTLINLAAISNTVTINYYRPGGGSWAPSETTTLGGYGDVVTQLQEPNHGLTGEGSIVAAGQAALAADVHIRAYGAELGRSAYSAVMEGAERVLVPAVFKRSDLSFAANAAAPPRPASMASLYLPLMYGRPVPALEQANSQLVVQNTGATTTTVTISLYGSQGVKVYAAAPQILPPNAAFRYDLLADGSAPEGAFSAVVEAPGGQAAVLAMIRLGPAILMSYTGAGYAQPLWYLPLFAARMDDGSSAEIVVQNAGPETLASGALTIECHPDPASRVTTGFVWTNPQPIPGLAGVALDGAAALEIPAGFWGHCRAAGPTRVYPVLLLRSVTGSEGGAYEGLAGDGQNTRLLMPIYAKRLCCGTSTAAVVQNLGTAPAEVTLRYLGGEGMPASCSATLERTLPVGSALVQDHRVTGGPDAVPELGDQCYGKLFVTADQPIAGVTMFSNLGALPSDETELLQIPGTP